VVAPIPAYQLTECLGDYPDTKNTVSLEQRYMIIYPQQQIFCWERFEMQCYNIVIKLQLIISPFSVIISYNIASHKAPNRIFAAWDIKWVTIIKIDAAKLPVNKFSKISDI
jgi:hypothetical protein